MWLPRIILACVSQPSFTAAGSAELLLYPRYHLDNASLLARYQLPQVRLDNHNNPQGRCTHLGDCGSLLEPLVQQQQLKPVC